MKGFILFLCNTTLALGHAEDWSLNLSDSTPLPTAEKLSADFERQSATYSTILRPETLDEIATDPSLEIDDPLESEGNSPKEIIGAMRSSLIASDPTQPSFSIPEIKERRDYFPWAKRLALRHIQGTHQGIGYGTDYTTAAALFAPKYHLGHTLPMVDARVRRFDNNTYAANLGLGGRYLPEPGSFCNMLGFNLFADWRQGLNVHHNYYQIGLGIEVLGKRWDFRANSYYPFGMTKHHSKCVFDYDGGFFIKERKCEAVSFGYNAEVGYLITGEKPFLLYAAAGPYYLARKCHDETLGGKVRIRPQYKDYLALDLSYSYDPVFRSVFQAEVIVSLPFYQIFSGDGREAPCGMSDRQVCQPIERFEIMPLGKRTCFHTNF